MTHLQDYNIIISFYNNQSIKYKVTKIVTKVKGSIGYFLLLTRPFYK